MKSNRRLSATTLILFSLLVSYSTANAATPQRIISLSPGITEMLFALGLGPRVVADTSYCDYPPAAKKLPHIGDAVVNYEAVVALRPDLVVADALANEQALPRLHALHLNILAIHVRSLQEVDDSLTLIAKATGTLTAAKKIVDKQNKMLEQIEEKAKSESTHLRTLVIVGTNPLYVAGSQTFVGDMITEAGGTNAVKSAGFISYSKEVAIADDPQAIFCSKDDLQTLLSDPAWSQTSAVKLHNLFTVDPNLIFRPGPRLIDGTEKVFQLLLNAHRP